MKYLVVALLALVAIASAEHRAKRQGGNNPCRTCEQILNIAENHFHRNITDEAALQAQLQQECARIGQVEGDQAGQDCLNLVNNNIDTIYNDLHAGKRPRQTCQDIGACQAFTGRPTGASVAPARRVKRQGGNNICRTCEQILNIAENHFHNNITDKNALLAQLQNECSRLGQIEGPQAAQDCTNLVDTDIDKIFADLQAGQRPRSTCQDIGACQVFTRPPTGASAAPRRVKRQGDPGPCRTCEQILNIAENHFHRNISDQASLLAQLQQECTRIGQIEGDQAAADCNNIVNNNIDTIYADLHAGKRPRQTCEDIGACQAFTRPTGGFTRPTFAAPVERVKRQGGNNPCRTCEQILNIAENHFHRNITDEAALQAQLQQECARIGQVEGDQAGQDCLNLVNNNIDTIYNDLHAGKRPRQTCQDIGACQAFTGRPTGASVAPVRRVKRQGGNNPCRTCEQILNIAENHFHRNITDEAALQAQLQQECARIGQVEGDQAGQDCLNLVNNNIDTIYNDLHAGKRPRQTCQDIGACQAFTGRPTGASVAPVRRVKRQGGNNHCRTCEQILNIAENHFHRNITDEAALQAQLQQECSRIGQTEGQQAGQDCTNLVNTNIDTIYNDLHAGKRPRQTCEDIGQCQAFTRPPTTPAAGVVNRRH